MTLENGMEFDEIKKPAHYNQGKFDAKAAWREMCIGMTPQQSGYAFQVLKYLWRFHLKGQPIKDLTKCKEYLELLIELEKETNSPKQSVREVANKHGKPIKESTDTIDALTGKRIDTQE